MNFPTLINSITKKHRTDIVKILCGLYSLNSGDSPVTVRAINELLSLHLGKGAPKNVSDTLRKYSRYAMVAAKGPPLTWAMTDDGYRYLAELSSLNISMTNKNEHDADIAIVCALEFPEFEAVIRAGGGQAAWKEISDPTFPHVYRETEITTEGGKKLKVIGVTSTSMGLTAAAIVTTQLVMRFRPRIIAMVGIAAGTYDGAKNFGDILVADPSVDYASGKVIHANGVREFQPDPYPIGLNPRLRSILQTYRGSNIMLKSIKAKWVNRSPDNEIRLFIGPVGAADQVIDDSSRIIEIQKNWRKLIGVEMETYGVYRACFESPDPKPRYVSFKAVCDFAIEKKDSWQSYAAFTAAEFALRFFEKEWEALWPKS